MTTKRILLASAVVLGAFALAGCGDKAIDAPKIADPNVKQLEPKLPGGVGPKGKPVGPSTGSQ